MTITEILDEEVLAYAKDKDRDREPKASPSSLGKCPRQLMLMERGFEADPFDSRKLKVFGMGYLVEDYVLNKLGKYLVQRQLHVRYRGISGYLDAIIDLDGKFYLIDVKSVNSMKFDFLDREGVDEGYAMQLTFYWMALMRGEVEMKGGWVKSSDVHSTECLSVEPSLGLIYLEKENCMTKEMWFDPRGYEAKVEARIDLLEQIRKDEKLPPEKTEINWECFSVSEKYKTVKVWCRWMRHCPTVCMAHEQAVKDMEIKKIASEERKAKRSK